MGSNREKSQYLKIGNFDRVLKIISHFGGTIIFSPTIWYLAGYRQGQIIISTNYFVKINFIVNHQGFRYLLLFICKKKCILLHYYVNYYSLFKILNFKIWYNSIQTNKKYF